MKRGKEMALTRSAKIAFPELPSCPIAQRSHTQRGTPPEWKACPDLTSRRTASELPSQGWLEQEASGLDFLHPLLRLGRGLVHCFRSAPLAVGFRSV